MARAVCEFFHKVRFRAPRKHGWRESKRGAKNGSRGWFGQVESGEREHLSHLSHLPHVSEEGVHNGPDGTGWIASITLEIEAADAPAGQGVRLNAGAPHVPCQTRISFTALTIRLPCKILATSV